MNKQRSEFQTSNIIILNYCMESQADTQFCT